MCENIFACGDKNRIGGFGPYSILLSPAKALMMSLKPRGRDQIRREDLDIIHLPGLLHALYKEYGVITFVVREHFTTLFRTSRSFLGKRLLC